MATQRAVDHAVVNSKRRVGTEWTDELVTSNSRLSSTGEFREVGSQCSSEDRQTDMVPTVMRERTAG